MNRKHGFTLVELMVTIAIAGLAAVFAGWVWGAAFKADLTTRYKIRSIDDANHLMTTTIEDISRMGSHTQLSQDTFSIPSTQLIQWSPSTGDTSHFNLVDRANADSLIFKTFRYDSVGTAIGVDLVSYSLNSTHQLIRTDVFSPIITSKYSSSTATMILADSVNLFNVRLGIIDTNTTSDTVLTKTTTTQSIVNPIATHLAYTSPSSFSVNQGSTYEVGFIDTPDTSYSNHFDQIRDTIGILLGTSGSYVPASGTVVQYIYPTGSPTYRKIYFTPNFTGTVNLIIYSRLTDGVTAGTLKLDSIYVRSKSSANYSWYTSTNSITQKMATQALEINLGISIKGQSTLLSRIVPLPANN